MTYVLGDYNILPKRDLHSSLWLGRFRADIGYVGLELIYRVGCKVVYQFGRLGVEGLGSGFRLAGHGAKELRGFRSSPVLGI